MWESLRYEFVSLDERKIRKTKRISVQKKKWKSIEKRKEIHVDFILMSRL